jgi:hypothetical protein
MGKKFQKNFSHKKDYRHTITKYKLARRNLLIEIVSLLKVSNISTVLKHFISLEEL